MDIAKYYVDQGNDPNAQVAIDKLLRDFSGNPLIARAVHDIAQHYRELKKYAQANQLYKHVVANCPGTEHALWSQADLIKSYLALGDDPNAETAVEGLLANFSDNPLVARAVWDTGQYYRELKKYEQANRLYKHVVANFPGAEHALWAQADLIKSYLALKDDPNAEAAVEKLLADFSDNPLISRAVHDTAYEHRKLEKYERADQLDQLVIDSWPGDEQVIWAKMDMAKTNILLGNDAVVEATIDNLIADFSDHSDLPTAIFMLGEEYYMKALGEEYYMKAFSAKGDTNSPDARPEEYYLKALAIWQRIVTELPGSAITPEAYDFSARCYRRLGEYEKAIGCYKKIVDSWPDFKDAGEAQFLIGKCYETLIKSGSLPQSEANRLIEESYQAVIEKYADSTSAKNASMELGWLKFKRGQWAEAAQYFELALKKDPEKRLPPNILYPFGRAYEEIGQPDKAAQIYREFIKSVDLSDPRIETVKARLEKLSITSDN